MSRQPIHHVFRQLHQTAARQRLDRFSDRDLLRRFVDNDQDAFAVVLGRHAALVLATCRRWLRSEHDAEDAFQAVFLLLARKANALPWRESVAGWLHRVAVLVCRKQLRAAHTRQRHERQAAQAAPLSSAPQPDWSELQQTLDEELLRLPDKFRGAVLLCCFEELSHEEAAARLNMTEATLRGRLFRGRELLRQRLARRGVQLGVLLVAGTMAHQQASAALCAGFVQETLQGSVLFATGEVVETFVSPRVLALAQGGLQTMFVHKLKLALLTVCALGFLSAVSAAGLRQLARPTVTGTAPGAATADKSEPKPNSRKYRGPEQSGLVGELSQVDAATRRITVKPSGQAVKLTLELAKDLKVSIADEPAKLDELKAGSEVVLTLGDDGRTVTAVQTWEEDEDGVVKSVNAAANSLTVLLDGKERTLTVRKEPVVTIDGYLCQLKDLEAEMKVNVLFGRDGKTAARLFATWANKGDLRGRVHTVDATKGELQVNHVPDNDEDSLHGCEITKDTRLIVNGVAGKLADLKPGMVVMIRKDADFKKAAVVRAWSDE